MDGLSQLACSTADRETIRRIFARFLHGVPVWAYGSRNRGTARPNSDLDMVVFLSGPDTEKLSSVREALEESSLPFRVDLFSWNELPADFQKEISNSHLLLNGPES